MENTVSKVSTGIDELSQQLLSTLEESIFFGELSTFLRQRVACDKTIVYRVHEDSSASLVSENGGPVADGRYLARGEGPAGHVIRTKKSYFSNSVGRDPLFAEEAGLGVKAELVIPVSIDGIVIGTIHFQAMSEDRQFTRDDITTVLEVLKDLKTPLANMKMYLSAKYLNEALMRKIEVKERELEESKAGYQFASAFKIQDKEIIGKSESMRNILGLVEKISNSDVNALVQGECGTGKEMIARRVHCRSVRKDNAFVSVDCTSLSAEQLEVELFGEEIGDFAKGHRVKPGLLESANNGTLFINNIEAMALNIQAKLTRYINEKMAFRVGGQVPYRSNVRIVGATVKNLADLVERKTFREDLFYSLNTLTLNVPSLRERKEDIELVANFFLNSNRKPEEHKSFSPGVIKAFLEYKWPGNVRELQNVVERSYILSDGIIIEKEHIADSVSNVQPEVDSDTQDSLKFSEMTLDELEKRHIMATLEHLGGNKTKTARTLGITVKTLYNKLHSYGMISSKEA